MEVLYRRHANRRLYDTEKSKQVTLDEIAESIRQGHRIKVMDQNSGDDITLTTLAQILVNHAREFRRFPETKQVLLEIISKGGGTMFDLLKNVLFAGVGAAYLTKEKAEEIVNELVAKGQLSKDEKGQKVKELMDKAEEKVKDFSTFVDGHVKKTVDNIRGSEKKEMEDLRQQIEELKQQVAALKPKPKPGRPRKSS